MTRVRAHARILRSGISRSVCHCWPHDGVPRRAKGEAYVVSLAEATRTRNCIMLLFLLMPCSFLSLLAGAFFARSQDSSKPDSRVRRARRSRAFAVSKEEQEVRPREAWERSPWTLPGSASSVVLVSCPCSSSLRAVIAIRNGKRQAAVGRPEEKTERSLITGVLRVQQAI